MRRNAKIEDGFMVPLEEQGDDDNLSKKASKSTGANNNNNNDRIKSPKKGISTASRKESVHVKAGDPKAASGAFLKHGREPWRKKPLKP